MSVLSLTEVSQSRLSDIPITNGQLIFCKDTGSFYKDDATTRIKMSSDIVTCSELPLAPLGDKIYLLLPNTLYFFNGEWVELNKSTIITEDTIYSFPTVGNESFIYIASKENKTYRWDNDNSKYYCIGSDYNEIKIINCGDSTI